MPETGPAAEDEQPSLRARIGRVLGGRFGRLVLPALVLQSVLVGGGYASGREVVEFGARFGVLGEYALLAIFLGFTAVSVLVFEFARVTRSYDYKSFVEGLIGRAWPAFDVLFVAMAILVIAVMAAAAGSILETTLGVPYLVSVAGIVILVGLLLAQGSRVIEAVKTAGSALLYGGFLAFAAVVLFTQGPELWATIRAGDASQAPGATPWGAVGSGILYVGYNLAVYPAVLFVLHRQDSRADAVIAGIAAGAVMTVPFALTYLAVLAFYPSPAVLDAAVPWLAMLEEVGIAPVTIAYGIVVGWTLLETSLGLLHAILDRVDRHLEDTAIGSLAGREELGQTETGLIGAGVLLAAALLAQLGIIDLVAKGYTAMAIGFLVLFALPLFTVGLYRIATDGRPSWRRPRIVVDDGAEAP